MSEERDPTENAWRLVASQTEPELRAAVAVPAQAVFSSEDTGFIGAADEHITLIEQVVGPLSQRVSQ